jgi:hypothetical protein
MGVGVSHKNVEILGTIAEKVARIARIVRIVRNVRNVMSLTKVPRVEGAAQASGAAAEAAAEPCLMLNLAALLSEKSLDHRRVARGLGIEGIECPSIACQVCRCADTMTTCSIGVRDFPGASKPLPFSICIHGTPEWRQETPL